MRNVGEKPRIMDAVRRTADRPRPQQKRVGAVSGAGVESDNEIGSDTKGTP